MSITVKDKVLNIIAEQAMLETSDISLNMHARACAVSGIPARFGYFEPSLSSMMFANNLRVHVSFEVFEGNLEVVLLHGSCVLLGR